MWTVVIILLASVILTRDDKNAVCGAAIFGVIAGLLATLPFALLGQGFDTVLLGKWMLATSLIGGLIELGCAAASRSATQSPRLSRQRL